MTEEGIDTGGKAGMSRKLVAGILALIIVISSLAGAYLLLSTGDKPFFQYSMSGMDGDPNVTGGYVITEPPVVGRETTIRFWRNYDNASYTTEDEYRFFQIFLPSSIKLMNGSERVVLSPGEPWNVTWTVRPIQMGDMFIKIGYALSPNITKMYDNNNDYYEMDRDPRIAVHWAHIIGFRVGSNSGEIIDVGGGGRFEEEFEISGYKDIVTNPFTNEYGYLYDVGNIVWLNITLKPLVDMPLMKCWVQTADWDNDNMYIKPVNETLKYRIVNLTAGTVSTLNFSFEIISELPKPGVSNSVVFGFDSEHSVYMITGKEFPRACSGGGINLPIWTSIPDEWGTRSTSPHQYDSESSLIINNNMNVTENGRREAYERKKLEI